MSISDFFWFVVDAGSDFVAANRRRNDVDFVMVRSLATSLLVALLLGIESVHDDHLSNCYCSSVQQI